MEVPVLEEAPQEEGEDVPVLKEIEPVLAAIDNISRARPQSGLQQASRVYEFLVEGGITRFIAVFNILYDEDFIIGPIRSIRPYMAYQALEHGGIMAHGGYSQRTRAEIGNLPLTHIVTSTYLWRDSSRKAPHNLYTHMEKLLTAAGHDGGFTQVRPTPPLLPSESSDGLEIEISYRSNNRVSYTYNEEDAVYLRFINGNPHLDRETGEQIQVRRVILRKTVHKPITGTELLEIDLTGKGDGYLYEEGRAYAIRWEYWDGYTRYHHDDETPVDTSYGNTWIQVVR